MLQAVYIICLCFLLFFPGHSLGNIKAFSYKEIRTATDNFHPKNKIGRGGFGTVYKVSVNSLTESVTAVISYFCSKMFLIFYDKLMILFCYVGYPR